MLMKAIRVRMDANCRNQLSCQIGGILPLRGLILRAASLRDCTCTDRQAWTQVPRHLKSSTGELLFLTAPRQGGFILS
jgi:hypothetical protein